MFSKTWHPLQSPRTLVTGAGDTSQCSHQGMRIRGAQERGSVDTCRLEGGKESGLPSIPVP